MSDLPAADIHLRSYGAQRESDRHAFAQLVLPVAGTVLLDIEGREGRLDPLHGALVAPGAWHAQCGAGDNQSIVVDIDAGNDFLAQGDWQRLLERPFTPLGAAARKLLDYMAHGMAAASSPIGLEGLEATPGTHLLVAESAAEWMDIVCQLLIDDSLANRLAAGGRALVSQRHRWAESLAPAIGALDDLVSARLRAPERS